METLLWLFMLNEPQAAPGIPLVNHDHPALVLYQGILFISDQAGLNKGEDHHALKRALSIGRRGKIRDRSSEGQQYWIAGMNLLAAIIIHWNTKALGNVVADLAGAGQPVAPDLLAQIFPLGL